MPVFLALVSGGQRLSSVAGVCHDFEMIVLHDMLSRAIRCDRHVSLLSDMGGL